MNSCCGTSKPRFFKGFVMARLSPLDKISDCKSLPTIPQTPGTLSPFVSICRPCVISAGVTSLFSCRAKYGAIEGILRSNTNTRAVLCFEVFEVTLKYRVLKGDQHPPLDFYGRCRCRAWGPLNLGRVYSWRISGPKITGWTGDL